MSRIKTEFRSSLSTETVFSLIGYLLFDESLAKGKSCTNERNKGYNNYIFKTVVFFVYSFKLM